MAKWTAEKDVMMDFTDQIARLDRAERLGAGLASAIQSWSASGPWSAEASIAPDRLSWELRLRVHQEPPLGDWSLQFGEAAHHLRAALDNLAVAIAVQSGVTRRATLKNIYFPICRTEAEWANAQSKIAPLPQEYRDAIEQVQPFQRLKSGQTVNDDPLPILSSLDNHDKHHLQVKPVMQPRSLSHAPAVEFETEEGAAASVPLDVEIAASSFADGEVLLRQRTKGRIVKVRGGYSFHAVVQVSLTDGREFGVTQILADLCQYTRFVISHIAAVE